MLPIVVVVVGMLLSGTLHAIVPIYTKLLIFSALSLAADKILHLNK